MVRFVRRYWQLLPVAVFVLGSIYLGLQAYDYLHEPVLLDIVWGKPVYANTSSDWRMETFRILMLMPTVFVVWWHSPFYFMLPYALSTAYVFLKLLTYVGAPV